MAASSRLVAGRCAPGAPCAMLGVFCIVATAACSSSKPAPAAAHSPELWGDLKPIVSVKELMRDMLDPVADNIFDAVSVVITNQGTVEKTPKTEEDWEKI